MRNEIELLIPFSQEVLGFFFFSSRRRHTRWPRDWRSDVCSSDLCVLLVTAAFCRGGNNFRLLIFDCRLGEAIANQQSTNQQFQLTAWSFFSLRSRDVGWIPRIFAACVLLLPVAVSTCWM